METQILLEETFTNLHKLHNLYILKDFYLVLSRGVYPRSSQPNSCTKCEAPLKCPYQHKLSPIFLIKYVQSLGPTNMCTVYIHHSSWLADMSNWSAGAPEWTLEHYPENISARSQLNLVDLKFQKVFLVQSTGQHFVWWSMDKDQDHSSENSGHLSIAHTVNRN